MGYHRPSLNLRAISVISFGVFVLVLVLLSVCIVFFLLSLLLCKRYLCFSVGMPMGMMRLGCMNHLLNIAEFSIIYTVFCVRFVWVSVDINVKCVYVCVCVCIVSVRVSACSADLLRKTCFYAYIALNTMQWSIYINIEGIDLS